MKLFIHGVPDTAFVWTPLVEALGLTAQEHRAPSLPGFDGAAPPAGFAATKDAYLGWLVEQLEAAATADGPVDLVGHDWGAVLSAMAAQSRPDLVRSWTVINAAPEPTYEWHALARTWQTPVLGEIANAMITPKRMREKLIAAGMPKAMADHEAPRVDRHMKAAILKLYRSAKNPADWTADFSEVAGRGLVLWGAEDPFVTAAVARRFSERWSLPLSLVDGAGHWGLCERPEAFAAHLQAHWSGAAEPRG